MLKKHKPNLLRTAVVVIGLSWLITGGHPCLAQNGNGSCYLYNAGPPWNFLEWYCASDVIDCNNQGYNRNALSRYYPCSSGLQCSTDQPGKCGPTIDERAAPSEKTTQGTMFRGKRQAVAPPATR
jgi:hypothetical protein